MRLMHKICFEDKTVLNKSYFMHQTRISNRLGAIALQKLPPKPKGGKQTFADGWDLYKCAWHNMETQTVAASGAMVLGAANCIFTWPFTRHY